MLLSQSTSSIQIGSIINMVGPPDSKWLPCDGRILAQSSYPSYISKGFDLHPNKWSKYSKITPVPASHGGGISKMGNTIIITPGQTPYSQLVFYSTDNGDTWQSAATAMPSAADWSLVANNGTNFVALQGGGSPAGAYSSDGINWTQFSMPAISWGCLEWTGSVFIATSGLANASLYYSATGTSTFTAGATFGTGISVKSFCKGHDGSNNIIFQDSNFNLRKTSNGTALSTSASPFIPNLYNGGYDLYTLAWLNNKWWTNDEDSTQWFYTSADGETWNHILMPTKERYMSYFEMGRASFYSGEEYVLIDCGYAGYDNWITSDEVFFGRRFNPIQQPKDSVFISKSKGAIILLRAGNTGEKRFVARLSYSDYDYTTHFQLPLLFADIPGMRKYIKVK